MQPPAPTRWSPDSCRYFETATSHRWLAQKLPDDHYFVAGNQGRFTDIPPDSIGSDDLQDFAFGNGLCNSSRPFSFFDCYMRNTTEDWGYYNAPRVAQLQLLYSKNKGPGGKFNKQHALDGGQCICAPGQQVVPCMCCRGVECSQVF